MYHKYRQDNEIQFKAYTTTAERNKNYSLVEDRDEDVGTSDHRKTLVLTY
jgi:hypothetical protein